MQREKPQSVHYNTALDTTQFEESQQLCYYKIHGLYSLNMVRGSDW